MKRSQIEEQRSLSAKAVSGHDRETKFLKQARSASSGVNSAQIRQSRPFRQKPLKYFKVFPSLSEAVYERYMRGQHLNAKRFRGGLAFKAHRRLYHSTLGLRVIKKKGQHLSSHFLLLLALGGRPRIGVAVLSGVGFRV